MSLEIVDETGSAALVSTLARSFFRSIARHNPCGLKCGEAQFVGKRGLG